MYTVGTRTYVTLDLFNALVLTYDMNGQRCHFFVVYKRVPGGVSLFPHKSQQKVTSYQNKYHKNTHEDSD